MEPIRLPGGYYLEKEHDVLVLRKPDGRVLAYFSDAKQYTPELLVRIIGLVLEDTDRRTPEQR